MSTLVPPTTSELLPFDYHPLGRVCYGPGSLSKLGEIARGLGGSRVLVVTDRGLEDVGHPQRALRSLTQAGAKAWTFDDVEQNPTTQCVDAGVQAARRHEIDMLVAIGGGSSMDCAKGINFVFTNGGQMVDYKGFGRASQAMLPSIGIPTTSGTGSEAQSYALIADSQTHMKMACGDRKAAFQAVILDPVVTASQPRSVTAVTGIDALSHALESYVSTKSNSLSRMFSRRAWQLLQANFELVLQAPDNIEGRGAMQLGAHYAGIAIENAMLGACHACANPLSAHYGLTHGVAIGIMMPHVLRFNSGIVAHLYEDLAHDADLDAGKSGSAADQLAGRILSLLAIAELPTTLSSCGVSRDILPLLAEESAEQWTGKFNPRKADVSELRQLFEAAFVSQSQ